MEASRQLDLEGGLDRAQVYEEEERARVRRALQLAREKLAEFRDRIRWAVAEVEDYSAADRRLPLTIASRCRPEEGFALQRDLARGVLGPILLATRIRMPVSLEEASQGSEQVPSEAIGLLLP